MDSQEPIDLSNNSNRPSNGQETTVNYGTIFEPIGNSVQTNGVVSANDYAQMHQNFLETISNPRALFAAIEEQQFRNQQGVSSTVQPDPFRVHIIASGQPQQPQLPYLAPMYHGGLLTTQVDNVSIGTFMQQAASGVAVPPSYHQYAIDVTNAASQHGDGMTPSGMVLQLQQQQATGSTAVPNLHNMTLSLLKSETDSMALSALQRAPLSQQAGPTDPRTLGSKYSPSRRQGEEHGVAPPSKRRATGSPDPYSWHSGNGSMELHGIQEMVAPSQQANWEATLSSSTAAAQRDSQVTTNYAVHHAGYTSQQPSNSDAGGAPFGGAPFNSSAPISGAPFDGAPFGGGAPFNNGAAISGAPFGGAPLNNDAPFGGISQFSSTSGASFSGLSQNQPNIGHGFGGSSQFQFQPNNSGAMSGPSQQSSDDDDDHSGALTSGAPFGGAPFNNGNPIIGKSQFSSTNGASFIGLSQNQPNIGHGFGGSSQFQFQPNNSGAMSGSSKQSSNDGDDRGDPISGAPFNNGAPFGGKSQFSSTSGASFGGLSQNQPNISHGFGGSSQFQFQPNNSGAMSGSSQQSSDDDDDDDTAMPDGNVEDEFLGFGNLHMTDEELERKLSDSGMSEDDKRKVRGQRRVLLAREFLARVHREQSYKLMELEEENRELELEVMQQISTQRGEIVMYKEELANIMAIFEHNNVQYRPLHPTLFEQGRIQQEEPSSPL